MITYKLSNAYAGAEGLARLSEFARLLPGQAAGILLALHELGGAGKEVAEALLCKHIHAPKNFRRLWPGSKPVKNVPKTVAATVSLYRQSFRKLPFVQIEGSERRGSARTRKPATLTDPVTGETFPNPFLRRKRKEADAKMEAWRSEEGKAKAKKTKAKKAKDEEGPELSPMRNEQG
jgi:hypothetical protein